MRAFWIVLDSAGIGNAPDAEAFGADPIPASLEYRPLLIPCIIADPANAPKIALKSNASLMIFENTTGRYARLMIITITEIRIYATPIAGTNVDVTFTILDPPPKRHHPVITARIPPMIHGVHFTS